MIFFVLLFGTEPCTLMVIEVKVWKLLRSGYIVDVTGWNGPEMHKYFSELIINKK